MSEMAFDPHRRLCPDGACIGVIGPDGRCGECGRTTDGRPQVMAGGQAESDAEPFQAADAESDRAPAAGEGETGFDAARRLCEDGSCVGVIGPDARCGVCGREAST
jgi:hypothetical protein